MLEGRARRPAACHGIAARMDDAWRLVAAELAPVGLSRRLHPGLAQDPLMLVVEVYSNSSSAPKRASSTALRAPSLTARPVPAPTIAISSSRPKPPLRFFFSRRRSEASCRFSAALRRSFCTFLSLVTALTVLLPLPVARP